MNQCSQFLLATYTSPSAICSQCCLPTECSNSQSSPSLPQLKLQIVLQLNADVVSQAVRRTVVFIITRAAAQAASDAPARAKNSGVTAISGTAQVSAACCDKRHKLQYSLGSASCDNYSCTQSSARSYCNLRQGHIPSGNYCHNQNAALAAAIIEPGMSPSSSNLHQFIKGLLQCDSKRNSCLNILTWRFIV